MFFCPWFLHRRSPHLEHFLQSHLMIFDLDKMYSLQRSKSEATSPVKPLTTPYSQPKDWVRILFVLIALLWNCLFTSSSISLDSKLHENSSYFRPICCCIPSNKHNAWHQVGLHEHLLNKLMDGYFSFM